MPADWMRQVVTLEVPVSVETLWMFRRHQDPVARAVLVDTALHAASTTALPTDPVKAQHPAGQNAHRAVHYAEQAVLGWATRLVDTYRVMDNMNPESQDPSFGEALAEWGHCRDHLVGAVEQFEAVTKVAASVDDARYDRDRGIGQ